MGIVIRQSFWGSVLVYAGVIIGYLNTLILMPYYLDVDQIGLIRLIQSNGMILIPLAIIGMNGSYIKYHPQFKDDLALKHRIFSFQIVAVILGSIIFSMLIYLGQDIIKSFFEEKSEAYNHYLYATVVIFISQSLFNYFISFLWSEFNVTFPSFLNEVFLRLANAAVIISYGIGVISFQDLILYILVSYIVTTVVLCIYIYIKHSIRFDYAFYRLESTWIRKLFGFGSYTLLITTCSSIVMNVSYILTSSYLGLEANGIFTISVYIGTIIELPRRVVTQVVTPVITRNFNENNLKEISDVLKRSSINLGTIGLLLSIGIITNLQDLYHLIPQGEKFREGFVAIVIIALSKICNMVFSVSPEILNYSRYYKINLLITVLGAVLMILFCVLLIPSYGILGAAASILLTTVLNNTIRYFVLFRKFKFSPFTIRHLLLLVIGVVVFAIIKILPLSFQPILSILIRSFVTTIIFLAGIYFAKVSYEFNYIVESFRNRFIRMLHG